MVINEFLSKELRITITQLCNYRCIFCHNDGISKDENITSLNDIVYDTIKLFIQSGGEDITFTGGEPLLNSQSIETIKNLILFIRKDCKSDVPITVVTNGSKIDDDLLSYLRNIDNFKFNLSIHSFDPDTYLKITSQKRFTLNDIYNNIEKIRDCNIPFKVNYVILKDINNKVEQIKEAIQESYKLGASSIKFIELLITDEHQDLFENYYELKSIPFLLQEQMIQKIESERKIVFKYIDEQIEQDVELVKCTCKVGCKNCLRFRPIALDIDGRYYPCFITEAEKIILNSKDKIETCFAKGVDYIHSLSRKYEDRSPILSNDPVMISEKIEIYAQIDENIYNEIMESKNDFLKTRYIKHNYYFYKPELSNTIWDTFSKSVRIRENLNNIEQCALIISENELMEIREIPATKIKYKSGSNFLLEETKEKIEYLLKGLYYLPFFSYSVEGYFMIYEHLRLNISKTYLKNQPFFFISFSPKNNDKDIVTTRTIIGKYNLKPIENIFFEYLYKKFEK